LTRELGRHGAWFDTETRTVAARQLLRIDSVAINELLIRPTEQER